MILRRRTMGSSGGGGEKPFDEQYLTFEAKEAGTFTLTIPSGLPTTNLTSVSYSLDGGQNWITTNNADSTEVVITTPTLAAGDKVLWKGSGNVYATTTASIYSKFSSTGNFIVYGNIMSLLYGDSFANKVTFPTTGRTFVGLFRDCTKLIDAPDLILPATTLANYCYSRMFSNSGIENAPTLPALTLVNYCYSYMFANCSSIKYVKCLATSISATGATNNWLQYASSTGTFVKDANTTWSTGLNGIPSGWAIVDA